MGAELPDSTSTERPPIDPGRGHGGATDEDSDTLSYSEKRTYFSVFIDALTVAAFLFGLDATRRHYTLADVSQPLVTTWNRITATWPQSLLYFIAFHLLLDDWQQARRIDIRSPQRPAPGGLRFFLDAFIVVMTFAVFSLTETRDFRLPLVIASVYAAGACWSLAVFVQSADRESRSRCARFVVSHALAWILFTVLYLVFPKGGSLSVEAMWIMAAAYGAVLLLEYLCSRMPTRYLRPAYDFLGNKMGTVAEKLGRLSGSIREAP